jgi:hypothetical protein
LEYVLIILGIPIAIFGLIYITMIGGAAIELVKVFLASLSGQNHTESGETSNSHLFAWLFIGIMIVIILLRVVGMDD